ncbi:hypothetical protein DAPPUDRAFT_325266 [Daphnia pulex]|uniref:Arrestin C-terminal-like domain-containing protein n=1 Tax=Daphnia pulex TaxID=6669 RepID=E9H477_DAPPU|nr:hypothetical protein DAPPUDRAFT_325266 [Daphnia pulex]|eukprot:EFX73485.1 hypothetical protein DAPPUDRAFT_325266 [Daphnia pulex]
MGIESLSIELDNSDGIYFPGQEVSGVVHISNLSSKILKGIYLECQGYAKFCFNELSSETYYSSEETYLDLKIPLITNEFQILNSNVNFDLITEREDLSWLVAFTIILLILPQKFLLISTEMLAKFGYGHVRYSIKVVLKRSSRQINSETCRIPFTGVLKPSWKQNYEYVISFTVRTIVDLNAIPKAAMPTQSIKAKPVFRWLCCRSGLITVKVYLHRTGYVAGETILLHADVDNQSQTTLLGSTVSLIESVDFHTHNKSKTYERILFEQKRRGSKFQDVLQVFPIVVPSVTPSYLQFCEIIDISYKVEFRLVDSEALASKLVVPLDILIGNVPLRQQMNPTYNSVAETYQ